MLVKILIVAVLLLAVFLVIVAFQPADFRITRSALMAAPPQAAFAQVNDFHLWNAWSPWAKMDTAAKNTISTPGAGEGATYQWEGNNKVGAGAMLITESHPSSLVRIKLDFLRPMRATNITEFTFVPEGAQTRVTWTMSGRNNFMGKAFGLVVNCDKMVGSQFAEGLASMKALVESSAPVMVTSLP